MALEKRKGADPVEAVIRPIVEGQIMCFIKEHPSILKGVDWYKPRDDRAITLRNSLSKRIVRDLTCRQSRVRLVSAFMETLVPEQPIEDRRGDLVLRRSAARLQSERVGGLLRRGLEWLRRGT